VDLARLQLRLAASGAAWITAQRGRFALFLPACMAGGVIFYFSLRAEPPPWLAPALAAAAFAAVFAARSRAVPRALLLSLAFACLGFASAGIATWRAAPWDSLPSTAVHAQGTITAIDVLPQGRRVVLASVTLDDAKLQRRVRIRLRNNDTQLLTTGDTVRVRALLRAPPPPAYPGGWDMQRDAFFAGLAAFGFAIGPAERVQAAPHAAWQAWREAIAARIMAGLPGERGAIAATLLTGLATAIPPADRLAFQASGLAHLLAVAGLHIGIVMGLVFLLVRQAMAASEYAALHWPTRQIAAIAALAAGALYMALTGAHVPILRSFAMASLVTLAVLTGRRAISLRALALAAVALMLVAPQEVMGVSFQMSFAAVLALVAGWEALRPGMAQFAAGRWWRRPALYAGGLAVTSALAGSASLPFAAYHFGNATLWYVPANVLAVPVTALWVMPCGLAALALMPFGCAALALAPMGWGIAVILFLARAVAAWPGALWPVPQVPPAALLLAAMGLVWLCLWRGMLRLAGVPVLLAGLALPFTQRLPDALVVPSARVVAATVDGAVLAEIRPGAASFEKESPGRLWGAPVAPFPATGAGALQCDAAACRWRAHGQAVLLPRGADAGCAGADLVLATASLPACAAKLVLDRAFVARNGATLLWVTASGPVIVTDRALRGDRPWVLRQETLLPAALTE
jgi:competence protein ComEC